MYNRTQSVKEMRLHYDILSYIQPKSGRLSSIVFFFLMLVGYEFGGLFKWILFVRYICVTITQQTWWYEWKMLLFKRLCLLPEASLKIEEHVLICRWELCQNNIIKCINYDCINPSVFSPILLNAYNYTLSTDEIDARPRRVKLLQFMASLCHKLI